MISLNKLLPPLSAKDRETFDKLVADYDAGRALVYKYKGVALRARKDELRKELKTCPQHEIEKLNDELLNLETTFGASRKTARDRMVHLNKRYLDFFPGVLKRAQAQADKLMAEVNASYAAHFKAFDVEPVGESPLISPLHQWKKQLDGKMSGLEIHDNSLPPRPPDEILPYSTVHKKPAKAKAEELV